MPTAGQVSMYFLPQYVLYVLYIRAVCSTYLQMYLQYEGLGTIGTTYTYGLTIEAIMAG